jgi:adrenodoxin-NADP+ reductase
VFQHYTHLLFASGCTTPREDPIFTPSKHVIPGISIVHWYNHHPLGVRSLSLKDVKHVTLIGQGNVSLDIARLLLTSPDALSKIDLPSHVLDVLRESSVEHVTIVGRRGPLEASFTNAELREMMQLEGASMAPIPTPLLESSGTGVPEEKLTRQQKRLLQLLKQGSKEPYGTTLRTWSLKFLRSPVSWEAPRAGNMGTLTLGHNTLDPVTRRAIATDQTSSQQTSLIIPSLGFTAAAELPFYDAQRGRLRNFGGRVIANTSEEDESIEGHIFVKNVYASGWAALGAKGTVSTTMMDSYNVAETILSDLDLEVEQSMTVSSSFERQRASASAEARKSVPKEIMNPTPDNDDPPSAVLKAMEDGLITTWEDWEKIDAEEVRRGEILGKERERMDWDQALEFLGRSVWMIKYI